MTIVSKEYLNLNQFAALARLSRKTMYHYSSRGTSDFPKPAAYIGRAQFWTRQQAAEWVARHRRATG